MEISNNIVLRGIPEKLYYDTTHTLTLGNQAYTDAVKFDRSTADLDPYLYFYEHGPGESLILPRGVAKGILAGLDFIDDHRTF